MSSREKLLDVAFEEIYQNGYSATSVDKILKKANMNKGSMYHFFKSKKELGLAVVNERVNSYIVDKYSILLKHEKNICDELIKLIKNRNSFDFTCGCKLNNLMQELSPIDKDFKQALEVVYTRFENIIEQILDKAVLKNEIKHDDTKALSMYIVASIEGCLGTAKKSQDGSYFQTCISQLELFLNSLKK
ncbi:TetR/AcrR family transcriptional regulator [uncultured Arcobacter sp.]|uniref:TetR/AcrR family transcriptional regulator n=1 Tax=uncultured Arcobacter sp. TaxID=165434 RepID=UPI00260A2337|nr:TetR/AcrR family transcriptional regulator [uncultured Arcobacter sp.]